MNERTVSELLLDELFEEIRIKHPDKKRLIEEAVQVGAMAMYCKKCRFYVMTQGKVVALGSDPCETCNSNFCNWKGRS